MTKAIWLADVLRDAGLKVNELDGWKKRGVGEMGVIRGVICHHTGSNLKGGDSPALGLIKDGRPDLPGPLSQLHLSRDGVFTVVAAGRCNHAGRGYWQGTSSGNSSFIGIEAENDGKGEPWPTIMMDAYARGVAAILRSIGADDVMCVGHKEWALPRGRKVDPTFDMDEFREMVEEAMLSPDGLPSTFRRVATTDPVKVMLRKGSCGESVRELQLALGFAAREIDGDFGPKTDKAVREFQRNHGLTIDGKVGPKTWAILLKGN